MLWALYLPFEWWILMHWTLGISIWFYILQAIFKLILVNGSWGIPYEIALGWVRLGLTDKSTLVQVMAWCLQATSHYLSQCWPRSMSPNGVTRPQWVNFHRVKLKTSHQNCLGLVALRLGLPVHTCPGALWRQSPPKLVFILFINLQMTPWWILETLTKMSGVD